MAFATAQAEAEQQQCIFCHIASGRVASKKVYEDEKVVAILDIRPANPGHVLLITKEHFMVMPQMPDDLVGHIGMVAKGISRAMLRALKAEGTTVFAANGLAAGQRASHFMMHIIPRMEKDGAGMLIPEHAVSEDELEKIRKVLVKGINKVLGKEEPEAREEKAEKEEEETAEAKKPSEKKKEKTAESGLNKKSSEKRARKTSKERPADLDEITKMLAGGK